MIGFCWQFPHHDLTVEAIWPGLFVDKFSNYWDVPFSLALDLASVAPDSGLSYHLTMHHNAGSPTQLGTHDGNSPTVPPALRPTLAFKSAFLYKKSIDVWRSTASKLKMVQPYDIFLSDPHVSLSGLIGKLPHVLSNFQLNYIYMYLCFYFNYLYFFVEVRPCNYEVCN